MNLNPMCSGDRCRHATGEVRMYPYGGGGNGIYCHACFDHENAYRHQRARETGEPANWPQVPWDTAKVYEGAE